MRRGRRLICALAVLVPLGVPGGAGAHTHLADLRPAPEAVVARPPGAVALVFSEPVDAIGRAARIRSAGRDVALDLVRRRGGRLLLLRPRAPLAAGRVDVRFRVLSRDGHVLRGRYGFRVRAGTLAGTTRRGDGALRLAGADGAAGTGAAVTHGLHELLFILAVGLALAGPPILLAAGVRWPAGALTAVCAGAALLSVLCASLTWLAADAASPLRVLLPATVVDAAGTSAGAGWLLRALLWAAAAGLAWPRGARRATWPVGIVLGAIALSLALDGHAGSHGAAGSVAVDTAHLLAAGAWLGGLVVLAAAVSRPGADRAAATAAFARTAAIAFAVLLASGIANGLLRVGAVGAATGAAYGRLVLVKLALALGIAALAAAGAVRMRRRTSGGVTWAQLGGELVLGAAALTIAAILVETAPPT